jgi:bifunctional non-homologous end joining protein LigD
MTDLDRPTLPFEVQLAQPALPRHLAPMQPRLAAGAFNSAEHLFEVKWDGVRALVARDERGLRIWDRRGTDLLDRLPELATVARQLPEGALIDAEVVVCDARGRPRYELLAGRLGPKSRKTGRGPLVLAFDLLYESYRPLLARPLEERRARLAKALLGPGRLVVPEHLEHDGEPFLEAVIEHDLEGIVAKRRDSAYVPGARTADWLKVHARPRVDAVICGVVEKDHEPHALVCAAYRDGALQPIGTAYVPPYLRQHVSEHLAGRESRSSPMDGPVDVRVGLRWLRAELCAIVEHGGDVGALSDDARFRSFRLDMAPADCRVEERVRMPTAAPRLGSERPRLVLLRSLFTEDVAGGAQ